MIYQGFDPHLKVTLDFIQLRIRLTQYRIKFWQQLVLTILPRQTNRKLRNVLDELFECDVCKDVAFRVLGQVLPGIHLAADEGLQVLKRIL